MSTLRAAVVGAGRGRVEGVGVVAERGRVVEDVEVGGEVVAAGRLDNAGGGVEVVDVDYPGGC